MQATDKLAGESRAGPAPQLSLMDIFVRIQAIAAVIVSRETNPELTMHAMAISESALAVQQRIRLSSLPMIVPGTGESIKSLVAKIDTSVTEIEKLPNVWKKETDEITGILKQVRHIVCG